MTVYSTDGLYSLFSQLKIISKLVLLAKCGNLEATLLPLPSFPKKRTRQSFAKLVHVEFQVCTSRSSRRPVTRLKKVASLASTAVASRVLGSPRVAETFCLLLSFVATPSFEPIRVGMQ